MTQRVRADLDSYQQASTSHAAAAESVQQWVRGIPAALPEEILRTHGKASYPFVQALHELIARRAAVGQNVASGHTALSQKLIADAARFATADSDSAVSIRSTTA